MLAACGGSDNGSTTGVAAITKGDHVKGSENAPVTIIEYASPTFIVDGMAHAATTVMMTPEGFTAFLDATG